MGALEIYVKIQISSEGKIENHTLFYLKLLWASFLGYLADTFVYRRIEEFFFSIECLGCSLDSLFYFLVEGSPRPRANPKVILVLSSNLGLWRYLCSRKCWASFLNYPNSFIFLFLVLFILAKLTAFLNETIIFHRYLFFPIPQISSSELKCFLLHMKVFLSSICVESSLLNSRILTL